MLPGHLLKKECCCVDWFLSWYRNILNNDDDDQVALLCVPHCCHYLLQLPWKQGNVSAPAWNFRLHFFALLICRSVSYYLLLSLLSLHQHIPLALNIERKSSWSQMSSQHCLPLGISTLAKKKCIQKAGACSCYYSNTVYSFWEFFILRQRREERERVFCRIRIAQHCQSPLQQRSDPFASSGTAPS